MLKATVVYNPISGRLRKEPFILRAARLLEKAGWTLDVVPSKSGEHVTELARQAAGEGQAAFFVGGGDGSIGMAVEGLIGSETALGVLPAGTANLWAREFHLSGLTWTNLLALEQAASAQAEARVQAVDVGVCNERTFLMWVGSGIDAKVVHSLEKNRNRKKIRSFPLMRYGLGILEAANTWDGLRLEIEVDGNQVEGHYVLAVVSNIRNYATGKISPLACLDDGLMDLWLFAGEGPKDTLRQVWNVLSGLHVEAVDVRRIPFSKLHMRTSGPVYFHLDGDPVEMGEQIEIAVQPRVLKVLVPPKAPGALFSLEGIDIMGKGAG